LVAQGKVDFKVERFFQPSIIQGNDTLKHFSVVAAEKYGDNYGKSLLKDDNKVMINFKYRCIHTQNYDIAIDYCKKGIEDDEKDMGAYNNLSIIYKHQNKPFKAVYNLTKIIPQVLIDENKAPSKDDYLLKDYNENESKLSLADLYIKRGKLWKIIMDNEEMCADYQKACDLGDCELFNTNCK